MTMPTVREVVCHFHEPVKAPLLRGAVLPALRDLPEPVRGHLERGWRHGPHILVHLEGPDSSTERAASDVRDTVLVHLRRHPSTARLTGQELAALSVATGQAELIPPPYEPYERDNSVTVRPGDPVAPGEPSALRADLLHRGVPAVSAMLATLERCADTPGGRVRATVAALAAFAAAGPGGLSANRITFRSHLERQLHQEDADGRLRAVHQRVWNDHRGDLRRLVEDVAGGGGGAEADAWCAWVRAARAAVATAPATALACSTYQDSARRAAAFADPAVSLAYSPEGLSPFHRAISGWTLSDAARRGFDENRFCVNVLYLLLAVADVTPAERILACSVLCDAITDLTGISWWQQLRREGRVSGDAPRAVSR